MQWYQYPILQLNQYKTSYLGPGTDTPHYADDLETPWHTPITAPLAGTVLQADCAAWGGEVFVQPDDKRYHRYYFYHPDVVEVKRGQHVNAGQEIALSGGQNSGGTCPAQPKYSTGLHTHAGEQYEDKPWITPLETGSTIPYGPDITPLLMGLRTGKIPIPTDSGNAPAGTTNGASGDFSPSSVSAWESGLPDTLVRVGLFSIAILIILGGFYLVFKQQINSAVSTGVQAAKVAVML